MANDKKTPVDIITHDETRANIPPAELEPVLEESDKKPIRTAWERRNRDLDPQLVWRGKDPDQAELTVDAPPIYRQEHVHPKALVDDLRNGREKAEDLFGHFGLTEEDREAEVEFYRHSARWSNRMILGDALQVMSSLAERERLKGQVQAIYIDPPYGIKFQSNFQWSTTSRDVKDGKLDNLTREPEQVKAFRDTWRDGIHSYLSYLRDRLTVARELLTESGSCFVQIGDENVHRVRALMDEVFGEKCFIAAINYVTTSGRQDRYIDNISNHILWYCRDFGKAKYRQLYLGKEDGDGGFVADQFQSDGVRTDGDYPVRVHGREFRPKVGNHWKTHPEGANRLKRADRLVPQRAMVRYKRFSDDFAGRALPSVWLDTSGGAGRDKVYVVQSNARLAERCILMATDPGDLVLDPTCGSGTTAMSPNSGADAGSP